jgi:hypothetical protein
MASITKASGWGGHFVRGVAISIVPLGAAILAYYKDKIGIHFDTEKVASNA